MDHDNDQDSFGDIIDDEDSNPDFTAGIDSHANPPADIDTNSKTQPDIHRHTISDSHANNETTGNLFLVGILTGTGAPFIDAPSFNKQIDQDLQRVSRRWQD
ncbi:MAG: hypothetical protein AMXMBFR75_20010 [Candidatus Hinthialibacteria bacterium]